MRFGLVSFLSLSAFFAASPLSTPAFGEEDRRILWAAKFALVPESEAHRHFGTSKEKNLDPRSIKVLVWNIKKGQEPGLERDLAIYGEDRDLLLISEGYMNPLGRRIFASFENHRWDLGIAFLYKKDNNNATGTLIGSKVTPVWTKIRQTRDREPIINTPKCLTFGKYPIAGTTKKLLAISIHGMNAVTNAAFKRHIALAEEEIIHHDGPVIFAGDFNTNLESKVDALMKRMGDLGMQSIDFRNDTRMRVGGNTIDYIFVRGLHPQDADVLGSLTSSDHKAMRADLVVDAALL